MLFRISTIIGAFLAVCLLTNPGAAQPFRAQLPAISYARQQPVHVNSVATFPANRVNVPAATTMPSRAATGIYHQSWFNYDRALRHTDRAAWNYDLRHGYNPYYNPYLYNSYGYSPYGYNPYGYGSYYNPYGYSPYAYNAVSAYSPYGYNPYSYGPYSGGPYSTASAYDSGLTPNNSVANTGHAPPSGSEPANGKAQGVPLAAVGIPNENGEVKWPLAFSTLLPESKREVRQKLDAQLQILATQAVINKANPNLAREATRNVEQLRVWLRGRQGEIAEGTYRDGVAFLRKLDDALDAMVGR